MFEVFHFSQLEIIGFFLVLVRISSFFTTWPVFGDGTVPVPVKILLSFIVSLIMFPVVGYKNLTMGTVDNELIQIVIREVLVGVTIGFLARLFFLAVHMAGQMASINMGISSDQVFNPIIGTRANPIEHFQILICSLFFLSVNGHHVLINALSESYKLIPLQDVALKMGVFQELGKFSNEITLIAIKLAAPVTITVLIMNIAMGIMGRAVPQINVLITSLPLNILSGFIMMFVSLPLFVYSMDGLLDTVVSGVFFVLKGM